MCRHLLGIKVMELLLLRLLLGLLLGLLLLLRLLLLGLEMVVVVLGLLLLRRRLLLRLVLVLLHRGRDSVVPRMRQWRQRPVGIVTTVATVTSVRHRVGGRHVAVQARGLTIDRRTTLTGDKFCHHNLSS